MASCEGPRLSTGSTNPRPISLPQVRLTNALANQGLAVTSPASASRRVRSSCPRGSAAPVRKNRGWTTVVLLVSYLSGISYSPLALPTSCKPRAVAFALGLHVVQPGEIGRQLVELLPLPDIGRMIVALGAFELNAEKQPRCIDRAAHFGIFAAVAEHQADVAVLATRPAHRARPARRSDRARFRPNCDWH